MNDRMTIRQAAETLGVCTKTIRNMIKRGDLIAYRIGTGKTSPLYLRPEDVARLWQQA